MSYSSEFVDASRNDEVRYAVISLDARWNLL
jgi:hypothetical protein